MYEGGKVTPDVPKVWVSVAARKEIKLSTSQIVPDRWSRVNDWYFTVCMAQGFSLVSTISKV